MDEVPDAVVAAAALEPFDEDVEAVAAAYDERLGSFEFLEVPTSPGSRDEISEADPGPLGWPSKA